MKLPRRLRFALVATALLLGAGWLGIKLIPIPDALTRPPVPSVEFPDRHGVTLRESRTEDRFAKPVSLDEIPPHLIHAILAAEDKRFFDHHGVDWLASARAAWDFVRHRRVMSGASTISQQLVKVSHPRARTVTTK